MQIPLNFEQPGDADKIKRGGFRLQRFEVLNWGTFDKQPWVLDLQGGTGLLTGANGSGKSTLVDGLLTLLVPNKRRNYNLASSSTGKKEREEKSYVQGAYSRTRGDDNYGSKPLFLREKDTLSVLLAYFFDVVSKQKVTLAQVLWMQDGGVKKFFVIADAELKIASDFMGQRLTSSELKKQLKSQGVEIFDEFVKYSQHFQKRFGLQSEKAIDLFNQTVSIKEIRQLNDFVRNHMLEKADVQEKINELLESYDNLTVCHKSIVSAKKQLEFLLPLTEETVKFNRLQIDFKTLEESRKVAFVYFAKCKLELIQRELEKIEKKLNQLETEKKEYENRLENLRQQAQSLNNAISNDKIGLRLQELKRQIEQQHKEISSRQYQANQYNQLAQLLGLPNYADSTAFSTARTQGDAMFKDIEAAFKDLQFQRDEKKILLSDLQKEQRELNEELENLKSRQSNIPKENSNLRQKIACALNLDETDIPFVGELLEVRPEAEEWKGAIERLFKGFGLCILVSEANYLAVNSYVNNSHLGTRLVYYRIVPLPPNPVQRGFDKNEVPSKLKIKQDNPIFGQWLYEHLSRHYRYICCETLEQFEKQNRAITKAGLIKHSQERHEKDDSFDINNRRQYILGWNNASKIKYLEIEIIELKKQLSEIEKQIQGIERQQSQRESQKSWLQKFMNFTEFSKIDWRSADEERQQLEQQKQELEASSDTLKQMQTQLQETQEKIKENEAAKNRLLEEIGSQKTRQSQLIKEQSKCLDKTLDFSEQQIIDFTRRMAAKLKKYAMTLETIDENERDLREDLDEELLKLGKQQESSRSAINMRMLNFKNAFPEATAEIGTSLDFLDEYIKLKTKIEEDDLPRHEQRFKELMNTKILQAVVVFKSDLEAEEEKIKENIDELNESLRQIDYTDSTYIELCYESYRHDAILDFKQKLKDCLGDVSRQSVEDNQERFKKIQPLIDKFKTEDKWKNFVTDVRNWLNFSVSERYRGDNTEKELHTDSSGKSGGQKVKLAYTILASAIAYQFGVNVDTHNSKSLRFVVIDEAFSKLDDNNARYAMNLFKSLNLQLLVITPKDKINVLEEYISTLHFVSNKEGNKSSLSPVTIEEFKQKRQEKPSNKND